MTYGQGFRSGGDVLQRRKDLERPPAFKDRLTTLCRTSPKVCINYLACVEGCIALTPEIRQVAIEHRLFDEHRDRFLNSLVVWDMVEPVENEVQAFKAITKLKRGKDPQDQAAAAALEACVNLGVDVPLEYIAVLHLNGLTCHTGKPYEAVYEVGVVYHLGKHTQKVILDSTHQLKNCTMTSAAGGIVA